MQAQNIGRTNKGKITHGHKSTYYSTTYSISTKTKKSKKISSLERIAKTILHIYLTKHKKNKKRHILYYRLRRREQNLPQVTTLRPHAPFDRYQERARRRAKRTHQTTPGATPSATKVLTRLGCSYKTREESTTNEEAQSNWRHFMSLCKRLR